MKEPSHSLRGGPPHPARSWPRSIGLALAALYGPQLLPLVATDLLEHGHCLKVYARAFPILIGLPPGISARIASDLGEPGEEVLLYVVASAVTAAALGGTAVALRRLRRGGLVIAALTALLSAFLSMAAVAILRA